MNIQSLSLADFRNYEALSMHFTEGTNIFYGDNAQGKTNILEALYLVSTTRSHRSGIRDRDLIRFGREEAHIRTILIKQGIDYQIDMHLKNGRSKGIAINGQKVKKAADLIGILHTVFFSPEDLGIIKNGPAERRRFMDMELCQLDASYLYQLNHYNKIVDQRNRLLKDLYEHPQLKDTLDLWDEQLCSYGEQIIERRERFIRDLNEIIGPVHDKISGGRERLSIEYEPNVSADQFRDRLRRSREKDCYQKITTVGPHRDDFSFLEKSGSAGQIIDLRKFGSQGQQRSCALSLKLSEIELVTLLIGDTPVLMLDDVLSELDSGRQQYLLESIGGIQTFITCTGLDEFVRNRFEIDRVFRIQDGMAFPETTEEDKVPTAFEEE